MKRFNLNRYAVPIWIVLVFLIVLLIDRPAAERETQSSVFCAYGKVFVEFEESGKVWGTILLNDNGKPIQCQEPTGTPIFSQEKINNI